MVAVLLGDRDDQAQVRFDHRPLRVQVAAFDPLRQLDFLSRGQERVSTGVAQEELEGVGRRLRREWDRWRHTFVLDDLDSLLLELAAESVELERFELALIEDLRECALGKRARLLGGLEQLLPLLARHGTRPGRCFEADRVVRQRYSSLGTGNRSQRVEEPATSRCPGFGVRYDCSPWPELELSSEPSTFSSCPDSVREARILRVISR